MEFQRFVESQEDKSFESMKSVLESEPYFLRIKEDNVKNENLYLICHGETTNMEHSFVRECNGLICEKDTNRIVCYSFDKRPEFEDIDPEIDVNSVYLEESLEGVLMRVYYNNKWLVSTKRCIDSNRARWLSARSFGDMFSELLSEQEMELRLNKNHCYSFLLCHPDNMIISDHQTPKIYHLLTRDMNTFEEINEDVGIEKMNRIEIEEGKSWREKVEEMKLLCDLSMEGYMIVDGMNHRQKVVSNKFKRARELWGNTNDRFLRYLEIRKMGIEMIQEYLTYYPKTKNSFIEYETRVMQFARYVLQTYLNKHVNRSDGFQIPKYLCRLTYELHGDFLKNRVQTDFNKVMEWISNFDAPLLLHLIHQYEDSVKLQMISLCK